MAGSFDRKGNCPQHGAYVGHCAACASKVDEQIEKAKPKKK